MVISARAFDYLMGLLDQLEDLGAETEERLAWRPGGSGLLADSAQVKAGAL
jgi:hypothetical protein